MGRRLFETNRRTEEEIMESYDAEIKEQKESFDFFALIKSFYDDKEYAKFTKNEKNKMVFMVNRRMAIRHPVESAYLSRMGISGYAVVDFWKDAITAQYKTYPGWLYTKTNTIKNKDEEKFSKFKTETIDVYLKRNNIELKTLNELFKRYPSELIEDLNKLEKQLTTTVSTLKNKEKNESSI